MKKKHAFAQEFIGKTITIVDSSNALLKGLKGCVVDETQSTFTINDGEKEKIIIKNQITFNVEGQKHNIEGKTINKRPEERPKMRIQNE